MAKNQKRWTYSPSKSTRPGIPVSLKAEVTTRVNELIESVLKPAHVRPHAEDERFNYIIDIFGKWYQSYFYFCATYRVAGENPVPPTFETKFTRMEYAGSNRFHLSFMRHTGQWVQIYDDLTLDECLASIKDDEFFQP